MTLIGQRECGNAAEVGKNAAVVVDVLLMYREMENASPEKTVDGGCF